MMGPQMRVGFIYEGAEAGHYAFTQNTITEEAKTPQLPLRLYVRDVSDHHE